MTSPRRPGRPATGSQPTRSMRIGPVYDEAKREAELAGETVTAVVERALVAYVTRRREVRERRDA